MQLDVQTLQAGLELDEFISTEIYGFPAGSVDATLMRLSMGASDDIASLVTTLVEFTHTNKLDINFIYNAVNPGVWTGVVSRGDGMTGRIQMAHAKSFPLMVCRLAVRVLVVKE